MLATKPQATTPKLLPVLNRTQTRSLTDCAHCPLGDGAHLPPYAVSGCGPRTAQLVVVGEAPGFNEVSSHQPFVGVSGKLIWDTLRQYGIETASVYRTNALMCMPPLDKDGKTKGPTARMLNACGDRLWGELGSLEHKRVILALGSHACRALRDDTTASVTKLNGVIEWSDTFECWVVYAYHPAFVLRSPDAWDDFVWAVGHAVRMLAEDATPPALPVVAYDTAGVNDTHLLWAAERSDVIVCDIETDGLDPRTDPILEIGLRWRDARPLVIPRDIFLRPNWREALNKLFAHHEVTWVGHNYKFDVQFLRYQMALPARIGADTMLMHYALDERGKGGSGDENQEHGGGSGGGAGHDLKGLARRFRDWPDWSGEVDAIAKRAGGHMSAVPAEVRQPYLALDLEATWQLYWVFRKQFSKEPPSRKGYWSPEECHDKLAVPVANAITDIELRGIHVDRAKLDALDVDYARQAERAHEQAKALAGKGDGFNARSFKQVGAILYSPRSEGGLGYPNLVKTDRFTLQELARMDEEAMRPVEPFLASIITARSLDHTRSLYIDGIREGLDENDDLHTHLQQHKTLTGRLACVAPNLQNLPAKSPIKGLFVARPGYTMFNADYKQLEVRVLAWYSRDPQLIADLRASDFHWRTCQRYFPAIVEEMERALADNDLAPLERLAREGPGFFADFWRAQCVPSERIDDVGKLFAEMKVRLRRQAKYVTFGPMYGEGAKKLASHTHGLGCEESEAEEFLANWRKTYRVAWAYLEGETRLAKTTYWVESKTGRRRRFNALRYGLEGRYATESRNQPIQAFASDINLMAMAELETTMPTLDIGWPLLPVHDSILGEIRLERLNEAKIHIEDVMTSVIEDDEVVFEIDMATGTDWGKCK